MNCNKPSCTQPHTGFDFDGSCGGSAPTCILWPPQMLRCAAAKPSHHDRAPGPWTVIVLDNVQHEAGTKNIKNLGKVCHVIRYSNI